MEDRIDHGTEKQMDAGLDEGERTTNTTPDVKDELDLPKEDFEKDEDIVAPLPESPKKRDRPREDPEKDGDTVPPLGGRLPLRARSSTLRTTHSRTSQPHNRSQVTLSTQRPTTANSRTISNWDSLTADEQQRAVEEEDAHGSNGAVLTRQYTKLANKKAHPWQHWGITLGGPMILLFDLVIPCIIYYTWYDRQASRWRRDCREQYGVHAGPLCPIPKPEFDEDILGSAIACFGFGELWILVARVYRLCRHPEQCAPLLSRNRWELDATSWVYGVAMILALIPFVAASSLELPHLYLYSPTFIMGFLGVLMLITTFIPFKIPIGINSHARGTYLRPFIYYAAEDFIAVDGLQDRDFRIRYNERYDSSKAFRRMFVHLTLWWELGVCVYIGAVSAVIWTVEFHIAFGLSFGVLFSYIACWAAGSYAYVMMEMKRQKKAWEEGKGDV